MALNGMDYEVGHIIWYFPFGAKQARRVKVTFKDDDIKNGRAGFDGTEILDSHFGMDVWGYDDQIVKVER